LICFVSDYLGYTSLLSALEDHLTGKSHSGIDALVVSNAYHLNEWTQTIMDKIKQELKTNGKEYVQKQIIDVSPTNCTANMWKLVPAAQWKTLLILATMAGQ
jgi:hypothetical protein